jgi:hypothetical protein
MMGGPLGPQGRPTAGPMSSKEILKSNSRGNGLVRSAAALPQRALTSTMSAAVRKVQPRKPIVARVKDGGSCALEAGIVDSVEVMTVSAGPAGPHSVNGIG